MKLQGSDLNKETNEETVLKYTGSMTLVKHYVLQYLSFSFLTVQQIEHFS